MTEESLIAMQWIEVMPPVKPEPVSMWIWILAVVLLLGITVIIWRLSRWRPRQCALRQLRQCEKQLRDTSIQPKQVAGQMYRALQTVMRRIPTLQSQRLDPAWQDYYLRLAKCVFHARQPDRVEVQLLLQETRDRLQRK